MHQIHDSKVSYMEHSGIHHFFVMPDIFVILSKSIKSEAALPVYSKICQLEIYFISVEGVGQGKFI